LLAIISGEMDDFIKTHVLYLVVFAVKVLDFMANYIWGTTFLKGTKQEQVCY